MSKFSKREEVAITQMVEDIMEEDHDLLAAMRDDDEDCCGLCGCELDDDDVSFQWLVRLADGRLAVYVEDEEDRDYKPFIVVIEPVPNAAGVFKENNTIYTLENIIDNNISITTIPILLGRKGFDKWVVVEGQGCKW